MVRVEQGTRLQVGGGARRLDQCAAGLGECGRKRTQAEAGGRKRTQADAGGRKLGAQGLVDSRL